MTNKHQCARNSALKAEYFNAIEAATRRLTLAQQRSQSFSNLVKHAKFEVNSSKQKLEEAQFVYREVEKSSQQNRQELSSFTSGSSPDNNPQSYGSLEAAKLCLASAEQWSESCMSLLEYAQEEKNRSYKELEASQLYFNLVENHWQVLINLEKAKNEMKRKKKSVSKSKLDSSFLEKSIAHFSDFCLMEIVPTNLNFEMLGIANSAHSPLPEDPHHKSPSTLSCSLNQKNIPAIIHCGDSPVAHSFSDSSISNSSNNSEKSASLDGLDLFRGLEQQKHFALESISKETEASSCSETSYTERDDEFDDVDSQYSDSLSKERDIFPHPQSGINTSHSDLSFVLQKSQKSRKSQRSKSENEMMLGYVVTITSSKSSNNSDVVWKRNCDYHLEEGYDDYYEAKGLI